MYSTSSTFKGLALVAILSLASFNMFADTIRLKDGSIIKGKITRFNGGTFSIEIGEGARKRQMTFSASEVESIQFDSPVPMATARTTQSVVKTDSIVKVSDNVPPAENTAPKHKVVITNPAPTEKSDDTTDTTASSSPPKVITTDTTPIVKEPEPAPPKVNPPVVTSSTGTQPKTTVPAKTGSGAAPIELNVKVLADNTANGWTSSGWVVRKGQRIKISGDGTISLGKGQSTTASGLPDLEDDQKLLKSVPTGALIAVIGDDNNDFIYVGAEREFTAARDGTLFLGVNEGNLNDNSGSFAAKVQIMPGGGD